jgi:hypothetical protein
MGYIDTLYEDSFSEKQQTKPGYVDRLMDEEIGRHFEETEETSAITGKRKVNFVGQGGGGANFLTHLQAGYKYDPMTKAKVYAAARFPELSEEERLGRYRYQDGEYLYRKDDGRWYSESPDLFHQKAKDMLGSTHWEPVIFGTAGELFGSPIVAGVFAGFGELVHQLIAKGTGGKPKLGGVDLAMETALGGLGSIPGRGAVRVLRKAGAAGGGRRGMRIAKAAGSDLPMIDFKEGVRLKKYYLEKYGVDLFDAQTTESRRLLDKINLYQDMPETADLIQSAKKMQDEQAYAATDQFFESIAPATPMPTVGGDVVKAINSSIQVEKNNMVTRAKPFYKKAFGMKTEIDISPHIDSVNELIANSLQNSPRRKKLVQFRSMLYRKGKESVSEEIPIKTDSFGRVHTKTVTKKKSTNIPESRIKQLDELKKTVDTFLEPKVGDRPIDNRTKSEIRSIKNSILKDLDDANEPYRQAREIWGNDAEALRKLTHKTNLKYIADLEGDKVVGATKKIFQTVGNHPQILGNIRYRIINEDPALWDRVLRTHLEDVFESTAQKLEGGADNAAKVLGGFWRKTSGTPKQHKLIAEGMGVDTSKKMSTWRGQSEQYKNFDDMTDLLRRVSLIARKESTTAVRQQSIKDEAEGLGRSFIKAYAYPLITYKKVLWDKITQFNTSRGRKLMAEALTNPQAQGELLRIRKLGPGTEAGIKATSTFFSLILGGEYSRGITE